MQEKEGSREKAQRIGEGKIGTEVGPETAQFLENRHTVYVGSWDPDTGEVWSSVIWADPDPNANPADGSGAVRSLPAFHPADWVPPTETVTPFPIDVCGVSCATHWKSTCQLVFHKLISVVKNGQMIIVHKGPERGDPLWKTAAIPGAPISLSFVELETRKRFRCNGVVCDPIDPGASSRGNFTMTITECFSTCPRYIQQRTCIPLPTDQVETPATLTCGHSSLPQHLVEFITGVDTMFLSTVLPDSARGADCSHRGGRPGFVRVITSNGATKLAWGDFHGKGMNQTLGNAILYPKAGLLFVDFDHGHTLQLSGSFETRWTDPHGSLEECDRLCVFSLDQWRWTENATRRRWELLGYSTHHPLLAENDQLLRSLFPTDAVHVNSGVAKWRSKGEEPLYKAELVDCWAESSNVRTYKFSLDRPCGIEPGQYCTMIFTLPDGHRYIRCWTIRSGLATTITETTEPIPSTLRETKEILISVKTEGRVTKWLEQVTTSPAASAKKVHAIFNGVEGSFTLNSSFVITPAGHPWKVLMISGGIGITPMVSMLTGLQFNKEHGLMKAGHPYPDTVVIHCERALEDVPFKDFFLEMTKEADLCSAIHLIITRESPKEAVPALSSLSALVASTGTRLSTVLVQKLVPDVTSRVCYLCGPPPFMATLKEALVTLGVSPAHILMENFEY